MRTPENVSNHLCRPNKFCKICKEDLVKGEIHLCPFSTPGTSQYIDNIGFVHFNFSQTTAQCANCFESPNHTCPLHPVTSTNNEVRPILCHLLFEVGTHGHFDLNVLYDPVFKKEPRKEERALIFDYLLPGMQPKLFSGIKTFAFKQPKGRNVEFDVALDLLRKKADKTVTEALLATILCLQFQNFCFVTTCSKAINTIIRTLVANGIIPKRPLVKGGQAICLSIPFFGIRFICLTQFLKGNCSDMIKQFDLGIEEIFYPKLMALDADMLEKPLPCAPEFHYYSEVMDSKELRLTKKLFWDEVKDQPFNYLASLEAVAKNELQIWSYAGLHFVHTSLQLQDKCLKFYGKPAHYKEGCIETVPAFKFVSMSSFLKGTFRTFALKENTLYTVKDQFGKR